jgi:hypothetical protein
MTILLDKTNIKAIENYIVHYYSRWNSGAIVIFGYIRLIQTLWMNAIL